MIAKVAGRGPGASEELLRVVGGMPMKKLLVFLGGSLPEGELEELMDASRRSGSAHLGDRDRS